MAEVNRIKTGITHLALIPDGNRRWARKRGLPVKLGHYQGIKTAKKILDFVFNETDITFLTMYGFSKYNFNRSEEEKSNLFYMMAKAAEKLSEWVPDDVGFIPAGNLSDFEQYKFPNSREDESSNLKQLFEGVAKPSKSKKYFTILIGYDGVDEIEKSITKMLKAQELGETVSSKDFQKYTYTSILPPVDLMIRTGNEQRLSGFMPYLMSYAEIHFDKKMWPSFGVKHLSKIIKNYGKRQRRFGK